MRGRVPGSIRAHEARRLACSRSCSRARGDRRRGGRLLLELAGPARRRATRRSTTRTTATTATSTTAKDLSNDKCLDCHDHNDLARSDQRRQGLPRVGDVVKGKKCETCHLEHKGRGYDIMGWKSVAGRREGLRPRSHRLAAQRQARGDRLRRLPQGDGQAGPQDVHGHRPAVRRVGLPQQGSAAQVRARARHARVRALPQRERVEAARSANQKFNHDDRKDAAMPLLGSHKDVACSKCHAKSVFNLPFAEPDSCGNAGCHQSPHDGHLFGKRDCEWCHSPTFKTLKQQNFDHTEKTQVRPRSRAPQDQVLRLPHQGARRGQAERARASSATRRTATTASGSRSSAIRRSAARATRRAGRSSRRTRSTTRANTKFTLDGKHAEVACRACHRGKSPSDFEEFTRPRSTARARSSAWAATQHKNVHDETVHRTASARTTSARLPHRRRASSTIRPTTNEFDRERYHGPQSKLPARQGPQGRAVRRLPHRPQEEGQDDVREDPDGLQRRTASATRTRCTRARSARSARLPQSRARGTRSSSITTSRSPRTPRARSTSSRSRASTRRTSARTATRSASSPRRRRRARPRAVTPTTTRTRAGSATSARSATSRPATTSSTTTR